MNDIIPALLTLSHEIGAENRQLAILGEGNTSARISNERFAIKASGSQLRTLKEEDVTVCDTKKVLAILDKKAADDAQLNDWLMDSRESDSGKKPSIESMFHAWLLSLPDVNYVGHCHPITANKVLCSPRARDFAERRLFPDEIVCCGAASVFVPYADPGLPLAREIVERTRGFMEKEGYQPRIIVLQNHGIIALGSSPEAVMSATLMADKAAAIFVGAAALGGPNFMTSQHVERIAGRPDEAYRQRQLKI